MQAVDSSILLYATLRQQPHHKAARELLTALAEGVAPWGLPWPCVYDFLRIVTNPRLVRPPMPPEAARAQLDRLLASPSVVLLGETPRHAEVMARLDAAVPLHGNLWGAAHVAALCHEHGVSVLYSADVDMVRFAGLTVVNPFAGA